MSIDINQGLGYCLIMEGTTPFIEAHYQGYKFKFQINNSNIESYIKSYPVYGNGEDIVGTVDKTEYRFKKPNATIIGLIETQLESLVNTDDYLNWCLINVFGETQTFIQDEDVYDIDNRVIGTRKKYTNNIYIYDSEFTYNWKIKKWVYDNKTETEIKDLAITKKVIIDVKSKPNKKEKSISIVDNIGINEWNLYSKIKTTPDGRIIAAEYNGTTSLIKKGN